MRSVCDEQFERPVVLCPGDVLRVIYRGELVASVTSSRLARYVGGELLQDGKGRFRVTLYKG